MSDVWDTVEEQRIAINMDKKDWRRSHQGIQAALSSLGIVLETSKKELDDMDVQLGTNGTKDYSKRCVDVSRNGKISPRITIQSLLTGGSSLKTKEERKAIWAALSVKMSLARPKGIPCSNHAESKAIDDLDRLIGVSDHMRREPLIEFRAYDIAYSPIGVGDVFVADQVKTGRVSTAGQVNFHANGGMLTVQDMIDILDKGSLTCIGRTRDGEVDVVWYFTATAIATLNTFEDKDQTFRPRLHLKTASNAFTMAMQSEMFRFDVRKSKGECDRLLQAKIGFLATGTKHSLKFWNEDKSQILSKNHQVEQKSMKLLQAACEANGAIYTKPNDIMYGPIDFLINGVRVQDKAMEKGKTFRFRCDGGLPYNPDELDVFQVTDTKTGLSYVMSMRVANCDGTVTSFHSVDTLMRENSKCGPQWKEMHKVFKHDLKSPEGTKSYVDACIAAGKIPPLTDRAFYKKMCDDNKNKIGPKRKLAKNKLQKST